MGALSKGGTTQLKHKDGEKNVGGNVGLRTRGGRGSGFVPRPLSKPTERKREKDRQVFWASETQRNKRTSDDLYHQNQNLSQKQGAGHQLLTELVSSAKERLLKQETVLRLFFPGPKLTPEAM